MNFFEWKEWQAYRRHAKGRHGLHSPFVYTLADEALSPSLRRFKELPTFQSDEGSELPADGLLRRLLHHFRFSEVRLTTPATKAGVFRPAHGSAIASAAVLFEWRSTEASQWLDLFKETLREIGPEDVIMIAGMHRSKESREAGKALCSQPELRMSIDLFDAGLLLFRNDFIAPQHFVLKYRR